MGSTEAPQWLLSAWRRSVEAVGATADRAAIESTGQALIERWTSEERVHHNLKRLIAVLARVDELAAETHQPDVVRLAAWYHGAVFTSAAPSAYAHRGGADAEASAELARSELGALGVPEKAIERIGTLIQYLSRHVAPGNDIDAQALCDADLGGLAAEPQRYEAYLREVREEYSHIPDRDYVEARLAIIGRLLERRTLFASPLGHGWENAARDNLRAERARLEIELTTLPERGEGEESHVAEMVAAKMAVLGEGPAEAGPVTEPAPLTAADRVDVARRAARERAGERRAAAEADRERRQREKAERAERKAREREAARRGRAADDDGSSMSRPPTR
ncbi:hypothetical protein GCM10027067_16080 [Pseudactinotalea suaedae]